MDCRYLTIAIYVMGYSCKNTSALGVVPIKLVVDGVVLGVVVEWLRWVIVLLIVVTFLALKDERSACCIMIM